MPDCRGGDCTLPEGRKAPATGDFAYPVATPVNHAHVFRGKAEILSNVVDGGERILMD